MVCVGQPVRSELVRSTERVSSLLRSVCTVLMNTSCFAVQCVTSLSPRSTQMFLIFFWCRLREGTFGPSFLFFSCLFFHFFNFFTFHFFPYFLYGSFVFFIVFIFYLCFPFCSNVFPFFVLFFFSRVLKN